MSHYLTIFIPHYLTMLIPHYLTTFMSHIHELAASEKYRVLQIWKNNELQFSSRVKRSQGLNGRRGGKTSGGLLEEVNWACMLVAQAS